MIMLIEKKGHELVLREGGLSPNTLQSNGRLPLYVRIVVAWIYLLIINLWR